MNNLELAQKLRDLADIYEKNPDMGQLYHLVDSTELIFCHDIKTFTATVRALGAGEKDSDDAWVIFKPKRFPNVHVYGSHAGVCIQVKKGEKVVPAQEAQVIPAEPERIVPASPERREEVFEWVCPSFTKPFVETLGGLAEPTKQIESSDPEVWF